MFPGGFIYNVDEVQSGAQKDQLNHWESVFQLAEENSPATDTTDTTAVTEDEDVDANKDVL
jgi:hypothetical protein